MLLFLLACTDIAKFPLDSAADSAIDSATDSVPDSVPLDSNTDSNPKDSSSGAPAPTISWSTLFEMEVASQQFYDLEYSDENSAFVVSSPYGASTAGNIMLIDDSATVLPDTALAEWTGSSAGNYFGVDISVFDLDGEEVVSSSEFCAEGESRTSCSYVGRWLVLSSTATSGSAQDVAFMDIVGVEAGSYVDGGYFGTAATEYADGFLVTQTSSGDSTFYAPTSATSITELTPLEVDNDPVPLGGQGYVGMEVANSSGFMAIASYGGVIQALSPTGAPLWYWTLEGGTYEGALEFGELSRDVNAITSVHVVNGFFAVEIYGSAQKVYILDPSTGEEVLSAAATSVTTGITEDGRDWTAYGRFFYLDEDKEEGGYITVVVANEDGSTSVANIVLPFEPPYVCAPKLRSNGAQQLAFICQNNSYGAIGIVEI